MINIESYSKNKESDSNTSNNGGTSGFANATTTIKTELETHELWGNKFNGTQDINGDLTSNGNIKAENAYVTNEVSGNTGNFNNLSATTLTSETATFTSVTSQTLSSSEIKANEITSPNATLNEITSKNINNSETITTKNLKVTSSAHFFELIIDRGKSVGGSMLITPADGFDVDIVQDSADEVKLLWQCQDEDGNQRDNMWKVNDQALCLSFNKAKVGTTHNVANKYYWALVTSVNKTNEPTVIDGVKYNYITLSKTTVDNDLTVTNNAKITTINSTTGNITTIKSNNITNTDTIKTKNLSVTGTAHFFNLIIDKIKSVGGAALFTPADGFDVDIVQDSTDGVKLLWQCQDEDGNQRDNMWKVNDQALCMSFNKAKVGTTHNVNNKYYWALVTSVNPVNEPTVIDGVKYNYITISLRWKLL